MDSPSRDEVKAQVQASEARVEARLSAIESSMMVMRSEMNTMRTELGADMTAMRAELKAAMQRSGAETVKWVAGIVISAMALGLTVMTFVLNNATPKRDAAPSPIVITIPASATK